MKKKGFTLVEVLISVGILSVLSAVIASIVFLVLRSTDKTGRSKEIKQSGEATVVFMQEFIRNSYRLENKSEFCDGNTKSFITVLDSHNNATKFSCEMDDENKQRIASSSAEKTSWITQKGLECSDFTASCVLSQRGDALINFSFDISNLSGTEKNTFAGRVYLIE